MKHKITFWIAVVFSILITTIACNEDMYYEPRNYPRKMIFTGYVLGSDSLPVSGIRIVLSTPDNLNHDTIYSDSAGVWFVKRTLEFAGPNKFKVRDIDQAANGGPYLPIDTSFYINTKQYDSTRVQMDFYLLPQ